MSLNQIGNNWDVNTVETIQENFDYLSQTESRVISDIMRQDPAELSAHINGASKRERHLINSSADFGVNFAAKANGVIAYVWVFSPNAKRLGLGMVEQVVGGVGSTQIVYAIHALRPGWNKVFINAPIQQGLSYTLFKRDVGQGRDTGSVRISPWSNHNFLGSLLDFNGGMFIHETGTHAQYSTFFEIGVITNLAQVYHLMNTSVQPAQQFYVGDNPPPDAKFWFKPVGG